MNKKLLLHRTFNQGLLLQGLLTNSISETSATEINLKTFPLEVVTRVLRKLNFIEMFWWILYIDVGERKFPPSKNLPILVTWASIGALFCTRFQQISLSQSSSRSQRIRGKDFLQQWKRESDRVDFCNRCLWSLLMLNGTPYLSHTASFAPSLTVFRLACESLLLLLDKRSNVDVVFAIAFCSCLLLIYLRLLFCVFLL